jgi:HAD superfamily hydrolase (TIGR01509 family)
MKSPAAILFDIDGTLVDSNYLHVAAWSRAFDEVGAEVDSWRIHRAIGMDSDKLLDALAPMLSERERDDAQRHHASAYADMSGELRAFTGARELLRALSDRGTRVVLATSAPEDELARLRELLDLEDAIDAVTSSGDVETAKPAPGIVQVALDRAGVAPADALFVGDTVWDVEAAGKAGVRCVGVLSGGVSRAELQEAGAIAVYSDVHEIVAGLDDGPLA